MVNKIVLMGRLTKDPEVRYTQTNNTMVASFTLAVNRRFSKEKEADFINIVAWSKNAEFVSKYFKKGQQVLIVGRLQTRNYEKEDGTKAYITEVVAEETYFADSKREDTSVADFENTFGTSVTNTEFETISREDLPF